MPRRSSFIKEKPFRGREMTTKFIPDDVFKVATAKKTLPGELGPEEMGQKKDDKDKRLDLYHEGYIGHKKYLVPDENLELMADDIHAQLKLRGLRDLTGLNKPSFEMNEYDRGHRKLKSFGGRTSFLESLSSTPTKKSLEYDDKEEVPTSELPKTERYDSKERKIWDPTKEFLDPEEDKGERKGSKPKELELDQKEEVPNRTKSGTEIPTTLKWDPKDRKIWDPDHEFLEPQELFKLKGKKGTDDDDDGGPTKYKLNLYPEDDGDDDGEPKLDKKEEVPNRTKSGTEIPSTLKWDPKDRKIWDPDNEYLEPQELFKLKGKKGTGDEDDDGGPTKYKLKLYPEDDGDGGDGKPKLVKKEEVPNRTKSGTEIPTTLRWDPKDRKIWDPDHEFLEPEEAFKLRGKKGAEGEEPDGGPTRYRLKLYPDKDGEDEGKGEGKYRDDGAGRKGKMTSDPNRLRLLISGHFKENNKPIYLIQEYRDEVDLFREQKADFQSRRKLADNGIDANISGRFYNRTILEESGGRPVALNVRPQRILIDQNNTDVYDSHFERVYSLESADVILTGEFLKSDITRRITPFLSLGVRKNPSSEKMDGKSNYGNAPTTVFTCRLNPTMPYPDK